MPFLDTLKSQLDRRTLRFFLTIVANQLAVMARHGVHRIFYDDGIWIYQITHGYFAYHHPYIRLNMEGLDTWARTVFLRTYRPRLGYIILDMGAGAGEEVLTSSRAVGNNGRVICVEGHRAPSAACKSSSNTIGSRMSSQFNARSQNRGARRR